MKARYELWKAGQNTADILLRAQRTWADDLRDEYNAVAKYNVALADFERQKGTILRYHNVGVAEGPIPAYAREHASNYVRELCQPARVAAAEEQQQQPGQPGEDAQLPALLSPQPSHILAYLDGPALPALTEESATAAK